jgi:hypothetical protein
VSEVFLLDPTAESAPAMRPRLDRPPSIKGKTIGLLDIAKSRGDIFLNRIDELLTERGFKVERFAKPRFSIVAPDALKQQIQSRVQVVIEGLAD